MSTGASGAGPRPAGLQMTEGSSQPEGAAKHVLGEGHTKGLLGKGQETGVASQQQRPREGPRGPEDTVWARGWARGLPRAVGARLQP